METEETKQPRFVSNRPVRILIFSVVAIIACVVLAGLVVTILKTSRNGPIGVDVYPGAQLIGKDNNQNDDFALYSTQDSVQQVLDFYTGRLPKDEDKVQGCQKIYTDNNPDTRELPGHYFGRCVVDNSQLDVSQQLMISINYQVNDTTQKPETRVQIQRHWGG